jgi:hypothetical protein
VAIIYVAVVLRCLGDGSTGPPATDHTREPADERADRATDRSDRRAGESAGNAARCLADVIGGRRIVVAHARPRHIAIVGARVTRHIVANDRGIVSQVSAILLIHDCALRQLW